MSWFKKAFGNSFSDPKEVERHVQEEPKESNYIVNLHSHYLALMVKDVNILYYKINSDIISRKNLSIIELGYFNSEYKYSHYTDWRITEKEFKKHFPEYYKKYLSGHAFFGGYTQDIHVSGNTVKLSINTRFPYSKRPNKSQALQEFNISHIYNLTETKTEIISKSKAERLGYTHRSSYSFRSDYVSNTVKNREWLGYNQKEESHE